MCEQRFEEDEGVSLVHPEKKTSQAEGTGSTRALRWEDIWFNPGAA